MRPGVLFLTVFDEEIYAGRNAYVFHRFVLLLSLCLDGYYVYLDFYM